MTSRVKKTKAGPGRPKGVPNKVTTTAKENMIAVFTRLGGTAAMAKWAAANETEFYKLYARLIPTDVQFQGHMTYEREPVPVAERDSDALDAASRAASNGHSQRPH